MSGRPGYGGVPCARAELALHVVAISADRRMPRERPTWTQRWSRARGPSWRWARSRSAPTRGKQRAEPTWTPRWSVHAGWRCTPSRSAPTREMPRARSARAELARHAVAIGADRLDAAYAGRAGANRPRSPRTRWSRARGPSWRCALGGGSAGRHKRCCLSPATLAVTKRAVDAFSANAEESMIDRRPDRVAAELCIADTRRRHQLAGAIRTVIVGTEPRIAEHGRGSRSAKDRQGMRDREGRDRGDGYGTESRREGP